MRKNEGTKKFIVRLYRATAVRGTYEPDSNQYVYKQSGRVWECDEDGNQIGNGKAFVNLGEMQTFISKKMREIVMKDLKKKGKW